MKIHKNTLIRGLIYLILLYLISVFLIYPLFQLIKGTFYDKGQWVTLDNYRKVFAGEGDLQAMKNTLLIGVLSVLCCMIVGVFLAFYTEFFVFDQDKKTKSVFFKGLLMTPFLLPGVIIVISNMQLYSGFGIISQALKQVFSLEKMPFVLSGLGGILFIHSFTQYIYFYLNTGIALQFLDTRMIESARSLGASRFRVAIDIIWPHIRPAVVVSSLMTFASAISSFSAPYLIGGAMKTVTVQVLQYKTTNSLHLALVHVVWLLLLSGGTILLYLRYEKSGFAKEKGKGIRRQRVYVPPGKIRLALQLVTGVILWCVLVPIVTVVILSFMNTGELMTKIFPSTFTLANYSQVFGKTRVLAPICNSLLMALLSAFCATLLAVIASYLNRQNNSYLSWWINFWMIFPIAIPASTLAIALITTFNRRNLLLMDHSLVGTYAILPLAYILAFLPLVSRSTHTAFAAFNEEWGYGARSLGASPAKVFRDIFLPIVSPGIVGGFLICFMRALGEYTMSALLYGVYNRPVSIAMVNALHDFDMGVSMVYGSLVIVMGMSFLALWSNLEK